MRQALFHDTNKHFLFFVDEARLELARSRLQRDALPLELFVPMVGALLQPF